MIACNLNHNSSMASIMLVAPMKPCPLPKISLNLSTRSSIYLGCKLPKLSAKPIGAAISRRQQHTATVCLFGSKGNSDSNNEGSPWKNPLENIMGSLKKEPSLEEVLRQQMIKQEYPDDGGSGGSPPSGGGGGGDGDGFGESDEEYIRGMLYEFMQVVLATLGFAFLYYYIINGEEITRFTTDFIKFLFGGKKSIRLGRAIDRWKGFFRRVREKKEVDPYWLEREILNTSTWWDSPAKTKYYLRRQEASRSY